MSLADSFAVCYIYFINIGAVLASELLLYIKQKKNSFSQKAFKVSEASGLKHYTRK